jgi:CPA2 family monovalent cation:H+ antiporter-2
LLLPYDKLFIIGTESQLAAAREGIEKRPEEELAPISDNFGLAPLLLLESDKFINKPIRDCGLREAINGLIIGIERSGERILSPDSAMNLLAGDLLWLVGNKALIKKLRS